MSDGSGGFGEAFDRALAYAADLHRADVRKGSGIPYIGHLLGVCALVIEDGGGETEAVAALLHDAAEDHGGAARLEEIRASFGDEVAAIVRGCSDSLEADPNRKAEWRERKSGYVRHLRDETNPGALRVSLADKVHNMRTILADYRVLGDPFWSRFKRGPDDQLWYYRALIEAYREHGVTSPLLGELDRAVAELAQLVAARRVSRPPTS
jgi:(p)ppGpp synthase/HD superfamily hydrolase